jgi:aminoglycoside phosphotransferase
VFDVQPDDLSTAGSCATALARRHRTDGLGRVEVTDRDDMPPGLHDPRAEARRAEAVPGPSAVGVVHEAPGSGTRSAAQSHAITPVTSVVVPAMMADVEEVEVVVAHHERATLRVGDVFLKIDADQTRTDVEVEAMAMAPVPTPQVLWRKPPVLALAALPGTALGRLGEPSTASSAAWAAAGAAARMLHDAPLPPWPGWSLDELASHLDELASHLDGECEWLLTNGVLPADVVTRNRRVAEAALRPWTPVFTHGDLHVTHVFVDGDEITGVVDWSEAGQGDALFDLASLTLGHQEHLGDVVAGYGTDVDLDVIRAWWSLRCLRAVRWLVEHGFDPWRPGCEADVLRSRL